MAKSVLNRGTNANDGTGDSLREAALKINNNFSEIYNILGDGENLLTANIDFGSNKVFYSNSVQTQAELSQINPTIYKGFIVHVENEGALYYSNSNSWNKLLSDNSEQSIVSYEDSLDPVAYSGNYSDLRNRPTLPSSILDLGILDGLNNQVLYTDGNGGFTFKDVVATNVVFGDILERPTTLAGYGINDAFSGLYEDLIDKPDLFSGDYNDLVNAPSLDGLATKAYVDSSVFSGNYIDLAGKPILPTDVNQLTDVDGRFFSRNYSDLTNVPNQFLNLDILSMSLGVSIDEFSNDGTMSDNSSSSLVTERAVKTYVDNAIAPLGTPYNQSLNTNDSVTFASLSATSSLSTTGNLGVTGKVTTKNIKQNYNLVSANNNTTLTLANDDYQIWAFATVGTNVNINLPDDEEGMVFTFINYASAGNSLNVNGALATFTVAPGETKSFLFDGVDWSLLSSNVTSTPYTLPVATTSILGGVKADGTTITITDQGVISASSVGNFTLSNSIIDTDDSSAISITPAVVMQSDLTVENDLVVNGSISTQNSGTPEVYSETDILLTATDRVTITQSPFKLASFTTTERNALVAQNGDMIYNKTDNKFQGYQNGSWINLDGTV